MTIRYCSQTAGVFPFPPDLSPTADRSVSDRHIPKIETFPEAPGDGADRDAWLTLITAIALGGVGLSCLVSAIVPFIITLSPHPQPVIPEQINREALSYLK